MAILEVLPGIEVLVCTNGVPTQEYDCENDRAAHEDEAVAAHQENVTVTKWVESQDDQVFTIKLLANESFKFNSPALIFDIYVDDKWVQSTLMMRGTYFNDTWSAIIEGPLSKSKKKAIILPMKFARIETTSEDTHQATVEKQIKQLSTVGNLHISVYRVSLGKQTRYNWSFKETSYDSKIHEKALKGESKSHGVTFGAPKPAIFPTFCNNYKRLDGSNYPIAIYKFNYRSHKGLQASGVIPRSPSPEPEIPHKSKNQNPERKSDVKPEPDAEKPLAEQGAKASVVEEQESKTESKADVISASEHRGRSNSENPGKLSDEEYALFQKLLRRIERPKTAPSGNDEEKPVESSLSLLKSSIKREVEEDGNIGAAARKRRTKKFAGKTTVDLTEDDEEGREYIPVE